METQAQPILRPLRLGELLDRAIRLYRGNFLTFIGIIAVVYIPVMVLQTAAGTLMGSLAGGGMYTSNISPSNYVAYSLGIFSTIIFLIFVQIILVQGIATGALTRAVADNYLGKKTGILDAYRGIGKSWLTLLAALTFVFIIAVFLLLWWLIPCVGWFTGFGMFLFLVAAVNPLVAPIIVLEASGPWSTADDNILQRFSNWIIRSVLAINRAWSLSRRRFWPLLGYSFILYLFSWIVVNGPSTIVNIFLAELSQFFDDPTMQLIVTSIIQGLVQLVFVLIYYPLQMTAFTLIYFDLRVRTEGFDIAILTMETSDATDLADTTTIPVPEVKESFMSWTDIGNFAILTLAGFGLYIFFFIFIMGSAFFLTSLF